MCTTWLRRPQCPSTDYEAMEHQLTFFLSEDPTNALAPIARNNLAALTHRKDVRAAVASPQATTLVASLRPQTFPNSDMLKAQLNAVGEESDGRSCEACNISAEANGATEDPNNTVPASAPHDALPASPNPWTIRRDVDEITLFFAVSSHGRMVNDLRQSDIKILDDNKPPERWKDSPRSRSFL